MDRRDFLKTTGATAVALATGSLSASTPEPDTNVRAVTLTSVKPHDTYSVIGFTSPGIHPVYEKTYKRRARVC